MPKIQRLDQHLINVGEAFGKQSPQYAYALSELHQAMNGESKVSFESDESMDSYLEPTTSGVST